jgi:acyl-CoA ligase (AMP-forming) (exosortase A-associated)
LEAYSVGTLQDVLFRSASAGSARPALVCRRQIRTYSQIEGDVRTFARGLFSLGLARHERIAVFLDKQLETVTSILGAAAAGFVFVPINPSLRATQVTYIMGDCNVRVLITTRARLAALESVLDECRDLRFVFLVDGEGYRVRDTGSLVAPFEELIERGRNGLAHLHPTDETDMVGILYTSGSTGNPKGVVFSHRNFVVGAQSVSQYLRYELSDRIINIPPYSFDFGLNQLFSTLHVGATAVLHNYVTPEDLMSAIVAEKVTGVSAVPTVMIQLAAQQWPPEAVETVRYLSTTGGRMPELAVKALRRSLPRTDIYLMYGLTEAFRSTYLPPSEIDRRPNSIGKAIPNAEVLVVRPDGTICDPEEPGELVHKGVLVTLGYWNDPARTAERFRPAPGEPADKPDPELAVWSGDTVKRDAEGFIYYVGRTDEMIKTSGYRVSPTEVEEAVFSSGEVAVAAAVGVEDDVLGQTIVVFATPKAGRGLNADAVIAHCRKVLPGYMVPQRVITQVEMPLNPNGKVDRKRLGREYLEQIAQRAAGNATSAAAVEHGPFLASWRNEVLEILGRKPKSFRSVADVYQWAFPGSPISSKDSFVSLGGDSLSYVNVSIELNDHLGRMPDDWAERPIAELEQRHREESTTALVAPDILLRVGAMIGVVASHTNWGGFAVALSGASKLMLLISGLSFVRFNWNEDPRRTLRSVARLFGAILVPTLILLVAVFSKKGEIDWPNLLFFNNLVSRAPPTWWIGAWYIQNLLQFVAFAMLLAFIPSVRRLSFRCPFLFSAILVAAGLAAYMGSRILSPAGDPELFHPPQDYFWLFALGWLFAAATTKEEKAVALVMLIVSIIAVLAAHSIAPQPMFQDSFWVWLGLGGAYLLAGWSLPVPMYVNRIIVLLARAMLFVYLLHWPIGLAFPIPLEWQVILGTVVSVVLWIVWESFWRACRTAASAPQSTEPRKHEPGIASSEAT